MNDKTKNKPAPDSGIEDYVINTGVKRSLPDKAPQTMPSSIETLLKAQKKRSIARIKGKLT